VKYLCKVKELAERRAQNTDEFTANFDWMREIEKLEIDYTKVRTNFIDDVRKYFKK